jgi:cytochrome c oxidase cbb3-type subunit 4
MDLHEFYPLLRSVWVVWFVVLFVGIVAWALWPSRRQKMEEFGRIPLRGDE